MLLLSSTSTSRCATCRLRSFLRAKAVARQRFSSFHTPRLPRPWAQKSLSWLDNGSGRLQPSLALKAGRTGAGGVRAKSYKSPSAPEYTREQFSGFLEGLYRQGELSATEWRVAVLGNAGMEDQSDVEARVRVLGEWFGGSVPGVLLGGEEEEVARRLRVGLREVEVRAEGKSEEEVLMEEMGRVARTREDMELEEADKVEEKEEVEAYEEADEAPRQLSRGNRTLQDDMALAMARNDEDSRESADDADPDEPFLRSHPLSLANRFATSPSTLEIPQAAFVEPVTAMLANLSNVHLADAAHRIFGGPGMPYSTSTPARGKLMQQKAIALDASQSSMAERDGDVYLAALFPGIYASVMSTLTETRRRLGTAWAEGLVRKAEAGELRILDAGGGGAGILAVREVLRAEWERMHEEAAENATTIATADGKVGGMGVSPPLGSATVLTGSDVLRRKVSKLLENTTFVPRLPDYMHTETQWAKGKFDLVIAPHTLWPLREDYIRKPHVQNLWSLLSSDGGVLILLEKGVARGFELVAAAREMLLDNHVASPDSTAEHIGPEDSNIDDLLHPAKEPGMIIAPCTNHASCPMYAPKGLVKGRRDICAFEQRYHRPQFLQRIYGTKGRNHEDVEFSYLSIMRGRDLRAPSSSTESPIIQDADATDRAFKGYESAVQDTDAQPHSLTLPRLILPPLKRHGHAVLDLCTPAGTLERWTVPRSFSKQAYRDARKSGWGDLWALGAKTRVLRTPKVKRPKYLDAVEEEVAVVQGEERVGTDEYGRLVLKESAAAAADGGRLRSGRKVKGVRDKRDKKASGNGRRRRGVEE